MRLWRVLFVLVSFVGLSVVNLPAQGLVMQFPRHLPGNPPPSPSTNPSRSLPPSAQSSVGVMPGRFKLLTSTTGWAANDQVLFRTTDGGVTWKDITPPNPHHTRYDGVLASVFFLDANSGWVLLGYR